MCARVLSLLMFLAVSSFAIGYPHGVFACRATQGTMWQGSSQITSEKYRVTVYPDYLDVEMEWVLNTGGTPPAQYRDAIEIVGNINLQAGSVVVGLLLWNGETILKAKLKPIALATDQYEQVVDRNAPVPARPRDPMILSDLGNDNYDLSIFPVTFGGTRTLRLRYLVPAHHAGGRLEAALPGSFTSIASSVLLRGAGVRSFVVRHGAGDSTVVTADSVKLAPSRVMDYRARIEARPEQATPGSRLYIASFDASGFSGQMAHWTPIPTQQAIALADINEDYVILWRWNHPEILTRYARQIVEQANLLQQFLIGLDSRGKRVALIIDRQGQRQTVFRLSGKGDAEYQRMMKYLFDLSTAGYTAAPSGGAPVYTTQQTDSIVAASLAEFQEAVAMALALFSDTTRSLRHLVLLSAGPRWVSRTTSPVVRSWDESVDVSTLSSQMKQFAWFDASLYPAETLYWEGVDLTSFANSHTMQLTVQAILTNGTQSATYTLTSQPAQSSPWWYYEPVCEELLVYSPTPLRQSVQWSVLNRGVAVGGFSETPAVITMPDPMNFARLLGASARLVNLGGTLPASMAATLGFMDRQYALLALEDDAMSDSASAPYRLAGVPTLNPEDIVMGTPGPDTAYTYSDPFQALASMAADATARRGAFSAAMVRGTLVIALGAQIARDNKLNVSVFSLSGELLVRWSARDFGSGTVLSWTPQAGRLSTGVVVVKVTHSGGVMSKTVRIGA